MQRQIGQTLGHQALRRVHQEDRLLSVAQTRDQSGFLAAVLSVVTRIGLVGDQSRKIGHLLLEVGIDRHPRAVATLVVVESRPRFVGHHLVDDMLGIRQRVGDAHNIAQCAGKRVDTFLKALRRQFLTLAVGRDPLVQRTGTAEHLVEARMGGAVAIRGAGADLDVEVVAHLVDESDVLPGELACSARQRLQVRGNEPGPLLGEAGGGMRVAGHLRQLAEQGLRADGERGRVRGGLIGDLPAQPGVAGEGVHVALLDAVEPQAEQEVFANEAVGLHTVHVNCNT